MVPAARALASSPAALPCRALPVRCRQGTARCPAALPAPIGGRAERAGQNGSGGVRQDGRGGGSAKPGHGDARSGAQSRARATVGSPSSGWRRASASAQAVADDAHHPGGGRHHQGHQDRRAETGQPRAGRARHRRAAAARCRGFAPSSWTSTSTTARATSCGPAGSRSGSWPSRRTTMRTRGSSRPAPTPSVRRPTSGGSATILTHSAVSIWNSSAAQHLASSPLLSTTDGSGVGIATVDGGTSAFPHERGRSSLPAVGILSHDEILELHAAIVSARLLGSRTALLAGLDPDFVAGLPQAAAPGAQVLTDLDALNAGGECTDGTTSLETWLRNAVALVGPRSKADVFRRALERLRDPLEPEVSRGAEAPSRAGKHTPTQFNITFNNSTIASLGVGEGAQATGRIVIGISTKALPPIADTVEGALTQGEDPVRAALTVGAPYSKLGSAGSAPKGYSLDPMYINLKRIAVLVGTESLVDALSVLSRKNADFRRCVRYAELLKAWLDGPGKDVPSFVKTMDHSQLVCGGIFTIYRWFAFRDAQGRKKGGARIAYTDFPSDSARSAKLRLELRIDPSHVVEGSPGALMQGKVSGLFACAMVLEPGPSKVTAVPLFIGHRGP